MVDQVLLNHKGPIRKFQCSLFVNSCPDIDRWIVFLSNHGIQEFILHCLDGELYKVPSRLFSCQHLRYLELTDCIIRLPLTFSYLANLKTLVLRRITINSEALKRLLLKWRFLENLRLRDIEGISNLEILAPNLKRISIIGSFRGLLLNTPLLASARIDLLDSFEEEEDEDEDEDEEEDEEDDEDEEEDEKDDEDEEADEVTESCVCNLIKVLGHPQYIQKLEMKNGCL